MKTLMCPDCSEVMHRVEKVTAQTHRAGIDQLSRHCTEMHVIPAMERMLTYTAGLDLDINAIWALTRPTCPGCQTGEMIDSQFYLHRDGRTILCCSAECLAKVC